MSDNQDRWSDFTDEADRHPIRYPTAEHFGRPAPPAAGLPKQVANSQGFA